eukprot:4187427-Alexandrium_andersonii.AAC.1
MRRGVDCAQERHAPPRPASDACPDAEASAVGHARQAWSSLAVAKLGVELGEEGVCLDEEVWRKVAAS